MNLSYFSDEKCQFMLLKIKPRRSRSAPHANSQGILHLTQLSSSFKLKQVPGGTTMCPQAYFRTFFSNFSNFSNFFSSFCVCGAGLKHFYSHFRSGFTIIYGENYAFLSLLTKALRTDGPTDGPTDGQTLYGDAR